MGGWLGREIAGEELLVLAIVMSPEPLRPGWSGRLAPAGATAQLPASRMFAEPLADQVNRILRTATHQLGQGRAADAIAALTHALRLAAPERLRRPFREAPEDVRQLLSAREIADRHPWLEPPGRPRPFPADAVPAKAALAGRAARPALARRPAAIYPPQPASVTAHRSLPAARATAEPDPVIAPLTAKEREVLAHLDDLLTTEEIARTMCLSVNTVKTHVGSILRKLSASRRNQAVRRARELGLLLPSRAG